MLTRWLAVVAVAGALGGCALALQGPDPNRRMGVAPTCDTGKGSVALDGVIGSAFGLAALVTLAEGENEAAGITALIAAAYVGSAVLGSSKVDECREAFASYERERDGLRIVEERVRPLPPPMASTAPAPRAPATPVTSTPAPTTPAAAPAAPTSSPPSAPTPSQPPATRTPPAAATKPAPADEWSDFWQEVP